MATAAEGQTDANQTSATGRKVLCDEALLENVGSEAPGTRTGEKVERT